jgi:hypothetical protein
MPDSAPNAELLRSLGRLVRGLSMLFWGLPLTMVICILTAIMDVLRSFNIVPSLIATVWLVIALWQLGHFQKQERIWIRALDRAKWLALVNAGLSPFLFWWNQRPNEPWFMVVVSVMAFTGLLFLYNLNMVLYRLTAMLPDEALREETRQFSILNRFLLTGILLLGMALVLLMELVLPRYSLAVIEPLRIVVVLASGGMWIWLLVFLSLLPLAMTMALLWKIKEVILDSVFGAGR